MKKFTLSIMSVAMLVVLSGCFSLDEEEEASATSGGGGDTNASTQGGNEAGEVDPYDFSEHLTISFLETGSPKKYEGNAMYEYIEDKFNITMDVQFVDSGSYEDQLNTLAASGNLPDVMRFGHSDSRIFTDWAERGALYDVKPLLDDYPALRDHIPQWAWEILNPSGHYYGVPEYRLQERNMLAIRQDWLDQLGLDVPETIDEFYEVAYAFAHDDPNQTGMDDTVGFSSVGLFDPNEGNAWRGGAFGLARQWYDMDGELVPYQAQREELREYIAFMKKAYEEGVLDRDFMLHNEWTDPNALLSEGIVGIEYVNPNSTYRKEEVEVKETDPNAELTYFPPPKGPDGERTTPTRDSHFKKILNADMSEEKVRRMLAIYEWNVTEGYEITRHGLEDIHWTKNEDGTIEELDKWEEDEVASIGTDILRAWNPLHRAYWWLGEEFEENLAAYYEMNAKYHWRDDNPGLMSETNLQQGAQLDSEFERIMTEIVVGQRGIEDVDVAVDQWLENGGQQIIDEINEQYAQN
ncbi:extracellular solute-binding protein [Salipaludibacillus sp. LMS25]|uniref:extracellular solute-binding protein n=1 Tax=Salipaludibacillus sp. LMS25 TaxID=2924031 RepID=UPI0020D030BA|nr:extracellular solute-binding protein [Salipaludibacillus sp. LMS25]UTR16535.1 extracellular solute-binding protein [Salipaludibacillus sp. LMS25]